MHWLTESFAGRACLKAPLPTQLAEQVSVGTLLQEDTGSSTAGSPYKRFLLVPLCMSKAHQSDRNKILQLSSQ